MRKSVFLLTTCILLISNEALANDATWTIPYVGSCPNVKFPSQQCVNVSNNAPNTTGILGASPAGGTGIGVMGTGPRGVLGYATSFNNANGFIGAGVVGFSSSFYVTNGNGVYGTVDDAGIGVSGQATTTTANGIGVKGTANGPGTPIWGHNTGSPVTTAGWFDGVVYSNGVALTSDLRLKRDVHDLAYGTHDLLRLRPVSFRWKNDTQDTTQLGLIAQEVEKVLPEAVSHARRPDSTDEVLAIRYDELVPVLVKTIQEQDARIAKLETERSRARIADGALFTLPLGGLAFVFLRKKRQTTT